MYPNIVNNNDSVLILFCAAYEGGQDVKYYIDNSNVTLVDLDEDKMRIMKNKTYSNKKSWKYIVDDVYNVLSMYNEKNIKFDIVSADPWTNMEEDTYEKHFIKYYNCSNKYLIMGCCKDTMVKHYLTDCNSVTNYIRKTHKLNDIKCIDILKRSDYYSPEWTYTKESGVFWLVFEKSI